MKKRYAWLFTLFKTAGMAMVVSCLLTSLTTGIEEQFVYRWGQAFCFGWPVAMLVNTKLLPWLRTQKSLLPGNA